MVERQLRRRGIRDERVLAAMGRVPREQFVLEPDRRRAYADRALPIGFNQTISQPYMVAAACELLGLSGDENVLGHRYRVGVRGGGPSGACGVGDHDRAGAGARRPCPRVADSRRLVDVAVLLGDGSLGVPERAPFHAVAVAAAAPRVPESLYAQLLPGGRLVLPIGSRANQRLALVVRTPEGPAEIRSLPCRYVPLLGAEGFSS